MIKEHPVLLNRAPNTSPSWYPGVEPTLVEGRAIRLHPLVCTAYKRTLHGDQNGRSRTFKSSEAQAEAPRLLMLADKTVLTRKTDKPVVTSHLRIGIR